MSRGIPVAAAFDRQHSLLPLHRVATLLSSPCFSYDQFAGAAWYVSVAQPSQRLTFARTFQAANCRSVVSQSVVRRTGIAAWLTSINVRLSSHTTLTHILQG